MVWKTTENNWYFAGLDSCEDGKFMMLKYYEEVWSSDSWNDDVEIEFYDNIDILRNEVLCELSRPIQHCYHLKGIEVYKLSAVDLNITEKEVLEKLKRDIKVSKMKEKAHKDEQAKNIEKEERKLLKKLKEKYE